MKKFMKGCGITALILLAVGFVLAAVAGTIRGRTVISEVVEAATGGRVHLNLGNWWEWGFESWGDLFDNIGDSMGEVDYGIGESMDFNRNYDVLSGDVKKYSVGDQVQKLEIEVGGCSLITKSSGDNSFYAEAQNIGKFQCFVEGDTLYVKSITSSRRWNQLKNAKITLYVPDGSSFEEADIELGAGVLEFEELSAKQAFLEVGAGQIKISRARVQELEVNVGLGQIVLQDMDVAELEAEIGMGELEARGAITEKADIICSMGNVEMTVDGREEDFNFDLQGGMGNMDVGSMSHSGLGFERTADNGAAKKMTLECSMGNVNVRFTGE